MMGRRPAKAGEEVGGQAQEAPREAPGDAASDLGRRA